MRIPLLGGSYNAKGVIASAQSCINLYPEINPESCQPPTQVTHYLTPGLDLLSAGSVMKPVRCTYRASNGDLYVVRGGSIYYVNVVFDEEYIGTVSTSTTIVSMCDNGQAIIVVDGGAAGYAIEMSKGNIWTTFDVGFIFTEIEYQGKSIIIANCHLVPFHYFKFFITMLPNLQAQPLTV